ncbi:GNAT family N-acetyltransferase [Ktedonosporobacter rubrisoli]|uniref:GNAT family N-acetyltransferase n=1 Tax=Ktedonosporobacter rubrisoli TaxID=2509675 RepID=A0A4P6K2N1_KTERU|nr:GNAT family N-acetyltransferase [Ktedonosporobacter rubrisoli]QBD82123.1 GNAT family N-acetyltransferase [Ktedonosporobacter rubrisoli]
MDEETPHIDVRAVTVNDAPALHGLDYSFETDRIYTLRECNHLLRSENGSGAENKPAFAFELTETLVDPPIYKNYREYENSLEDVEEQLREGEGGYIALANAEVAGAVLLHVEEWRSVALIEDLIVGRQFRRYGIGSLLLRCAADWARKRNCWAIVLETQNINYPAIQFYLRNGLEIWSIHQHFYPPGPLAHEVAVFMGKRLSSTPEQ